MNRHLPEYPSHRTRYRTERSIVNAPHSLPLTPLCCYQVHPGQIRTWKAVVLKGMLDLFSNRRKGKEQDNEALIAELYLLAAVKSVPEMAGVVL